MADVRQFAKRKKAPNNHSSAPYRGKKKMSRESKKYLRWVERLKKSESQTETAASPG